MARIQRIQTFLEDYNSINPYLKDLIKPIHQDYQKKLIQEYQKVSRHPYPNECLEITKIDTREGVRMSFDLSFSFRVSSLTFPLQ